MRVYIFSSSINLDNTWIAGKDSIEKELQPTDDEPPMYYDKYSAGYLSAITARRNQVVDLVKKSDYNHIFQIRIVIDDFADIPSFAETANCFIHYTGGAGVHAYLR